MKPSTICVAYQTDDVELLKKAIDSHGPDYLLDTAAEEGAIACLQYLVEQRDLRPTRDTLEIAAMNGRRRTTLYLLTLDCGTNEDAFVAAALGGNLELVAELQQTLATPKQSILTTIYELALQGYCEDDPVVGYLERELVKM